MVVVVTVVMVMGMRMVTHTFTFVEKKYSFPYVIVNKWNELREETVKSKPSVLLRRNCICNGYRDKIL